MKVIIKDKHKKELFVALFQILKGCSTLINIDFKKDKMHIQGMDKSHICLFDVNIQHDWFDNYDVINDISICIDTSVFHSIISNKNDDLNIIIQYITEDYLNIDLIFVEESLKSKSKSKSEFNKYFKISLANFEYEQLSVPIYEYEAEFTLSSKKICEIFSQMILFGNDININCSEDKVDLITNGITGEMLVNIPIDDFTEYSIIENEQINLAYSLNYINKMCLTNKLSAEIQIAISRNYPMKITYDLGDNSSVIFYIAPKITD